MMDARKMPLFSAKLRCSIICLAVVERSVTITGTWLKFKLAKKGRESSFAMHVAQLKEKDNNPGRDI